MRTFVALMLVAALAVPAMAGNNPCVRLYVDFDPGNYVHETTAVYSNVVGYIMADCLNTQGLDGGFTTVSFMLDIQGTIGGVPSFASLLPGGLAIGTYDTGITLASTECMTVEPVQIGTVTMFWLDGAGYINIMDHPEYPRWVVDCQEPGVVDYYCILANGVINGGAANAPEDCPCPCGSAVENSSWTGIKALYQ